MICALIYLLGAAIAAFIFVLIFCYEPIFEREDWKAQGELLAELQANGMPKKVEQYGSLCYAWIMPNNNTLYYWIGDKNWSLHESNGTGCIICGFKTQFYGASRHNKILKIILEEMNRGH